MLLRVAQRRRRDARHDRGHRRRWPGRRGPRDGDRRGHGGASPAPRRTAAARGAFGILFAPVTLLIVLFLAPMVIMVAMSVVKFPPNTAQRLHASTHYTDVLTNPLNLKIAWTDVLDRHDVDGRSCSRSASRSRTTWCSEAGRWELFLLLSLVLADELAPVVKVYAWQVILGRNGIVNWLIPGPPSIVAAVQPVRGDRDARGHVHHVHDDPDLRRDEGDRRRRCSSRRSISAPGGGCRRGAS